MIGHPQARIDLIRRLMLSRLLLDQAVAHERSGAELRRFAAINSLQDAVEVFLLAVADHIGAPIVKQAEFDKYLEVISAKLGAPGLPLRSQLHAMNRLRVLAKHQALAPDPKELSRALSYGRDFVTEVAASHLAVDFRSVTLVQLVRNDEVRGLLMAAEAQHKAEDFLNCLISVRRALYVLYESTADVAAYLGPGQNMLRIYMRSHEAASFAQNREFASRVKTPFDFIVVDRAKLDVKLQQEGSDPTTFWNICRVTPRVYRRDGLTWIHEHLPTLINSPTLEQSATYALEHMVTIALNREEHASRVLSMVAGGSTEWSIALAREGVPVYERADRAGQVLQHSPAGVTHFMAHRATPGLNDPDWYWHISYWPSADGPQMTGFVHESDISRP